MNATNRLIKFTFAILIIIVFVVISLSIEKESFADDIYFSNALVNRDLWTFLHFRYTEWSGRFFIELLTVTTINNDFFWKAGIPLCVIASSFLMWSICLRKSIPLMQGVLLSLFMLLTISPQVLSEAQWWVTGFYNYLLPMTCALFVVDSTLREKISFPRLAFSLCLSLIATSSEQIALGLLAIIICLIFKGIINKVAKGNAIITLVFSIAGTMVTFLSPGSENRFKIESSRFMPTIDNMNVFQKASIGLDRMTEYLSTGMNITFILCLLTFILYVIKRCQAHIPSYIMIGLCILALIMQLSYGNRMHGIDYISYEGKFIFSNFSSISTYVVFSFYSILLAVISIGSIEDKDGYRDYSAALCLIIGVLMTIAIGMSPTSYASSSRVFYVMSISMILHTLFVLSRTLHHK